MIRVLIADDSKVFQRVLVSCLEDEPGIQIVGVVDNGLEAVEQCALLKPDLVTMDIFMPEMNGLDATRQIMEECPTRIVIISSMTNSKNLRLAFEAMQAGAVEVINKPDEFGAGKYAGIKEKLINLVKQTMMAEPEKRFSWIGGTPWPATEPIVELETDVGLEIVESVSEFSPASHLRIIEFDKRTFDTNYRPSVICIGGSTGAPAVLSDILKELPKEFNIPIVVAQHIIKGFVNGMTSWLDTAVGMEVSLVNDLHVLRPGQVLFAPPGMHIGISPVGSVQLSEKRDGDVYLPSVNRLFNSAADYFGERAVGIILSGMGDDGAEGLLRMRQKGAVTVAQDEKSSVVYGMPKVATDMGAVMKELSPADIIALLLEINSHF